ncbi:MAG: hypothetical protein M3Z04_01895, partial [Chloroflexota bacterium]|nr:hypothetical protein [Chloroflexota bacterium]
MPDPKLRVVDDPLERVEADALILNWFIEDKNSLPADWKALDGKLNGDLTATLQGDELRGALYEIEPVHTGGSLKVRRVFLVGSGKRADFSVMQARRVAAAGARAARSRGAKRVA